MILILLLILLVCLFINVTKIRKKTYKTLKLSMEPNITRRTNSFNEGFTGFNKNEIVNTFNETGCPNKNPDTSWWGTQSKKTVLNDMYAYCNLTNDGTGNANQIKHCCGKNNPNCGKDKLTCKKQSDILPPYCAKSKTYGELEINNIRGDKPEWWSNLHKEEIFKEGNGSDYRGFQNNTLSGKKCKKWPSNFISNHSEDYDKGLSNNNYCRNPDSSDSIWCFTDNNTREFCSPLTNKIKEGKKEGVIEGTIDDNIMTQIQKDFIHKTKLLPDKVLKDFIHKTRVKPYSCPKCPEMSDYVLKSSVSCH